MTKPEETQSEETRAVSQTPPCGIKRERSEDEEPARRVVQRTETAEETKEEVEENSEAMMIKIVLKDLRSNNERTLVRSMERLEDYLHDEDNAKTAEKQEAFAHQVGGHAFTVRVMKEHPNCKILQILCIRVLLDTAYENASTQTAVAKVEGIQAILAAMERFPSDQAVINKGFGALVNIVSKHEANANLLVTKLCRIAFLITRMKKFQNDAGVAEAACDMLKSLSDFEHLRKSIVDVKAATALAYAIERHGDNPAIQEYARKAIKMLL